MGGGIPKPAQSSEAMGDYSEVSREDRSNGAGPGRNVQGSGAVSVTIQKRELGGERGDTQGPDVIPPLGGLMDQKDVRKTWGQRRVRVSSGRGGDGICRAPPHRSIHKEVADNNSGEGGLLDCLCIVKVGG